METRANECVFEVDSLNPSNGFGLLAEHGWSTCRMALNWSVMIERMRSTRTIGDAGDLRVIGRAAANRKPTKALSDRFNLARRRGV